jgi:hypothetical protein
MPLEYKLVLIIPNVSCFHKRIFPPEVFMKRLLVFPLLVLSLTTLLFLTSSCGGAKPRPTSESKATYKGVTLGRPDYAVIGKGSVKGILEPEGVFLTSDESIAAQAEFENLREEILVRWDWFSPGEKLYMSASRKVGPGAGLYFPKAGAVHAISVDGEPASSRPGLWAVELYVDGVLKESKKFYVEPGLSSYKTPVALTDPRKWALVVGIEKYSHLPSVEFAASDARKVSNYFVNLLGVPERNVILLENDKATRSAVMSKVKDYLASNTDAESTLYVYFAGHGMPDVATGEPYLMLFDSESTNVSRTGYRVREALSDIGALNVKKAFVFTDACFSGMAARGSKMLVTGARPAVIQVDDVNLASGKVVAFSASTGSQLSHSYREKRQGLFTYYLLSGLSGEADARKDGSVTLGELYGYVKENVVRVSRKTTMEQVPSVTPRIENVGGEQLTGPGATKR